MIETKGEFHQITVSNVSKGESEGEGRIFRFTECEVLLDDSSFGELKVPVALVRSSKMDMRNITVEDVRTQRDLFRFSDCIEVSIEEFRVSEVLMSSAVLMMLDSKVQLMRGIHAEDIDSIVIQFKNSHVDLIEDANIINASKGILSQSSNITQLSSSKFEKCGSADSSLGGAILIFRSNINLVNSEFINNTAKEGGAIGIDCYMSNLCEDTITNTTFISNSAVDQGGAISYNYKTPIITNVTHLHNSAPYGDDIASYPFNLIFEKSGTSHYKTTDNGSGLGQSEPIKILLVDKEERDMTDISTGTVKAVPYIFPLMIVPENPSIDIEGVDREKTINGVSIFSNMIFVAPPGDKNVPYWFFSPQNLDYDRMFALNNIVGFQFVSFITQISADFRYCNPGEIERGGICVECDQQSYSLGGNSTECLNCMNHADCLGKTEISVERGYWRKNITSDTVVECLREESCLGGYQPENKHPVKCAEGYEGILCAECVATKDIKYQPLDNFECNKCPSKEINAIEVIGFQILVMIFMLVLIIINFKKKGEDQVSVLMRIFTNYMQMMSAIITFDIDFPKTFGSVFMQSDSVTSVGKSFFSFDCFIEDYQLKLYAPSNSLFKLSLYLILPIFLQCLITIFMLLFRLIIHLFRPNVRYDFWRFFCISFISILLLFHPTMIYESLRIFQCAKIDNGDSRMILHMDYKCYSKEHLQWIFLLGVPIISIWGVIIPIIGFIFLFKSRKNLKKDFTQKYFLIIYQGLTPKCFYWEIVNTMKKTSILALNVFLATSDPHYKILCSIIALFVIYRIQSYVKPYKRKENNEIDVLSMISGIVTLHCGLVFVQKNNTVPVVRNLGLLVLLVVNAIFLLNWAYLICESLGYKNKCFLYFLKCFRGFLCKSREDSKRFNIRKKGRNLPKRIKVKRRLKILRKSKKHRKSKPKVHARTYLPNLQKSPEIPPMVLILALIHDSTTRMLQSPSIKAAPSPDTKKSPKIFLNDE